jgi:Tfp pilus assembly PilM family ATPase
MSLEHLSRRLAEREGIPAIEARERLLSFTGVDDPQALAVLDAGLAELADDLAKTIEFHAAQGEGSAVAETVISGPTALIPNFAEVLAQRMQIPVRRGGPRVADRSDVDLAHERVALAAGLAVEEVRA